MYQNVLDAFRSVIKNEGYTHWMYLDTRFLVTTGQGDLIDPISEALNLDWTIGGWPATAAEVIADWTLVKSRTDLAKNGGEASCYSTLTKCRLSDGAICTLVTKTMDWMVEELERRLPMLKTSPADAQLAMLRWAWANGPDAHYPMMFAALERGDYTSAAAQALWRNETSETHQIINKLFQNAANSTDPTVLIGV